MPVPWLPGSHLIVLSELLLFYPVSAVLSPLGPGHLWLKPLMPVSPELWNIRSLRWICLVHVFSAPYLLLIPSLPPFGFLFLSPSQPRPQERPPPSKS